ncbi:MAG TPA: hypothetical protein VK130_08235 [Steroidobacteraceae bacterium]|nr:hypothetical protein [Steroidobacteraceae bacterium]
MVLIVAWPMICWMVFMFTPLWFNAVPQEWRNWWKTPFTPARLSKGTQIRLRKLFFARGEPLARGKTRPCSLCGQRSFHTRSSRTRSIDSGTWRVPFLLFGSQNRPSVN